MSKEEIKNPRDMDLEIIDDDVILMLIRRFFDNDVWSSITTNVDVNTKMCWPKMQKNIYIGKKPSIRCDSNLHWYHDCVQQNQQTKDWFWFNCVLLKISHIYLFLFLGIVRLLHYELWLLA